MKFLKTLILVGVMFTSFVSLVNAQTLSPFPSASVSPTPTLTPSPSPTPQPRLDITQTTEDAVGPLEKALKDQEPGNIVLNPLKYAIRATIGAGVPANTIVLLLLLPVIAAFIAAARHIIGLRGFGIFFPASLAVVFLAIGPVLGITLFSAIVLFSTISRISGFVIAKIRTDSSVKTT